MKKKVDPVFLFLVLSLLLFPGLSCSEGDAAPNLKLGERQGVPSLSGADIRDIKGPVLPGAFPFEILAGLLMAGVLAVFAGYKFRQKRKSRAFDSPSPEARALAALDLLAKDLADAEMAPTHASRLGDILRRYLRNCFSLNALKLTTAETIPALKNLSELSSEDLGLVEKCLNEADAAKFALNFPLPEEMTTRVRLCREMIDRIAKRSVP